MYSYSDAKIAAALDDEPEGPVAAEHQVGRDAQVLDLVEPQALGDRVGQFGAAVLHDGVAVLHGATRLGRRAHEIFFVVVAHVRRGDGQAVDEAQGRDEPVCWFFR